MRICQTCRLHYRTTPAFNTLPRLLSQNVVRAQWEQDWPGISYTHLLQIKNSNKAWKSAKVEKRHWKVVCAVSSSHGPLAPLHPTTGDHPPVCPSFSVRNTIEHDPLRCLNRAFNSFLFIFGDDIFYSETLALNT